MRLSWWWGLEESADDVRIAGISCAGWITSSQQWAQENYWRACGMKANIHYNWWLVDRELDTARDRNIVWKSGKIWKG